MTRFIPHKNVFFHTINYSDAFTNSRIHWLLFCCWFSFIFIGTFLIGLTTKLYYKEFTYCQPSQQFCSRQFSLASDKELYIYVVLQNFYQNNRMFMDSYNQMQFQSRTFNNFHCQGYDTYEKLNLTYNAAGYRVPLTMQAYPCGRVMTKIFNDSIYLVSGKGSNLVTTSSDLVSQYNLHNKFINLQNYQLLQWTDMESPRFVNYFTLPFTSTKFLLLGKASLVADSYQLIVKNNYLVGKNSVVGKKILMSDVGELGIRDPVIGFGMFVWGIGGIFFHLFVCFKSGKLNKNEIQ